MCGVAENLIPQLDGTPKDMHNPEINLILTTNNNDNKNDTFVRRSTMPTIIRTKKKKKATKQTNTVTTSTTTNSHQLVVEERVDAAIQQLRRGIHRRVRGNHHEIVLESTHEILLHIRHCWIHVHQYCTVLQAGLQCFTQNLLPTLYDHLQKSNTDTSSSKTKTVTTKATIALTLQHLFQWLLRLHDGYIYIVSGECRHETDVHTAQRRSRYPSQLNSGNRNKDECHRTTTTAKTKSGGTSSSGGKLYSIHNTYSGTSWDEWMNEQCGLRQRLYALLREQDIVRTTNTSIENWWDEWSEIGQPASLLESIIVETEHQIQSIQEQFTELCHHGKFTSIIQTALRRLEQSRHNNNTLPNGSVAAAATTTTTVSLHWMDKMEQLAVVSLLTGGKLKLERYANSFQIPKGSSVLPLSYRTKDHWWNQGNMQWQTLTTTIPQKHPALSTHDNDDDKMVVAAKGSSGHNVDKGTKRRKVIVDSSSSSEDEENENPSKSVVKTTAKSVAPKKNSSELTAMVNPSTAVGLVVKLVEPRNEDDGTLEKAKSRISQDGVVVVESSVNDIKRQHGVDVETMEAAFDHIVLEEADSARAAELIDNDPTTVRTEDDVNKEQRLVVAASIYQAERHVRKCQRALQRTINDTDYNDVHDADTAIWNAREVFRTALMKAGDVLLWSTAETPAATAGSSKENMNDLDGSREQQRHDNILRAIRYFKEAYAMVTAQQRLHERMHPTHTTTTTTGSSTKEDNVVRFFRRNLLLLAGQAQTNQGIATIELAQQLLHIQQRQAARKTYLDSACRILDEALRHGRMLHRQAMEDATITTNNPAETALDMCQASQLQSLALRWKATALWYLFRKKDASSVFYEAASVFDKDLPTPLTANYSHADEEVVDDAAIECQIECYHAMTTLADLAEQSLQRASVVQIREASIFYDSLLDTVVAAMTKASQASKTIQDHLVNRPGKFDSLCREGAVLTSSDLLQCLKEVKEWWRTRKTSATETIKDTGRSSVVEATRTDLGTANDSLTSFGTLPTRRFIVGPSVGKRHRSKYNLGGAGYSNIVSTFHSDDPIVDQSSVVAPPRKYRKWREDMIVDTETGELVPKLEYPSIAPAMPPHIAAIFAARGGQEESHARVT